MTRKVSGGKYIPLRKKRLSDKSGTPRMTSLGALKKKKLRMTAGKVKTVLLSADTALVRDPKTNKSKSIKIKRIIRSPANRYFKNVMVKGTLIETELGKAKVTNRPGQEGVVTAVLTEED